jgi:hypothetical protein
VLCLSEFIITRTSPSSEIKQDSIQGTKVSHSNVSAERAAAKTNSRSEGIILQKRVEKKSN